MSKRKSTGKRLRFEIFKRDGFTCQYCGAQPPDIVLVIDHVTPVSKGGDSDPMNLVTACETCNQGKADKQLGNVAPKPDADLEWLAMQQEIAELRRYQLKKAERDELIASTVACLQDTWSSYFSEDDYVPADAELMRWLTWAEADQIDEAIRRASAHSFKLHNFHSRLKYTAYILRDITGTLRDS